jgi:hypothetical protein
MAKKRTPRPRFNPPRLSPFRGLGSIASVYGLANATSGTLHGYAHADLSYLQFANNPAAGFQMTGSQFAMTNGVNTSGGTFAQSLDPFNWPMLTGQNTQGTAAAFSAASHVPIVGQILTGIADAVAADPLADAARLSAKSDRMEMRMERQRMLGRESLESADQTRFTSAMSIADADQQVLLESGERRRQFELKKFRAAPNEQRFFADEEKSVSSAEMVDKVRAQHIADAIEQRLVSRGQEAGLRLASAQAGIAGTGADNVAFKNTARIERQRTADRHSQEMNDEYDPARRKKLAEDQAAELKALDEETDRERLDRKRSSAQKILQASVEGEAAMLRATKEFQKAELFEFEAGAKAKMEAVRTESAAVQEVTAEMIQKERQAMGIRQGERNELAIGGFQATGEAAALRAGRRPLAASLRSFDEQTRQQRSNQPRDRPDVLAAFEASRAAQRAGLVAEYGHGIENEEASLAARGQAAEAMIAHNPLEAQAIMRVAQAQAAVRNADPMIRSQVRDTQLLEMKAAREQLEGVRGGAFGITARMDEIVGDPFDLSGVYRDKRLATRQLDKGDKDVAAMSGTPDGERAEFKTLFEKAVEWLERIAGKGPDYARAAP